MSRHEIVSVLALLVFAVASSASATVIGVSARTTQFGPTTTVSGTTPTGVSLSLADATRNANAYANAYYLFAETASSGSSGLNVADAKASFSDWTIDLSSAVSGTPGFVEGTLNFDYDWTIHSPGPNTRIFDQANSSVALSVTAISTIGTVATGNALDQSGPYGHRHLGGGIWSPAFPDFELGGDPFGVPGVTTPPFPPQPAHAVQGSFMLDFRVSTIAPTIMLSGSVSANSFSPGSSGSFASIVLTASDTFVTDRNGNPFLGVEGNPPLAPIPPASPAPAPATSVLLLSGIVLLSRRKPARSRNAQRGSGVCSRGCSSG